MGWGIGVLLCVYICDALRELYAIVSKVFSMRGWTGLSRREFFELTDIAVAVLVEAHPVVFLCRLLGVARCCFSFSRTLLR